MASPSSSKPVESGKKSLSDGSSIYYEKHGNGPEKVLLVPGGTGTIRTDLQPLIDSLDKSKLTIVAFDPLGYGNSRPPERNYDIGIGMYKQDAAHGTELMSQLGYPSFTWIGWSDGGRTGLMAAALYPTKVDRLIIWGALPVVTERQRLGLQTSVKMELWNEDRRTAFYAEYGEELAKKMWARHVSFYQTLSNLCQELVPKIRCPTLILHGKKDVVELDLAEKLSKQIPISEIHVWPEGGHNLHMDENADFTRKIHKFIESYEPDVF